MYAKIRKLINSAFVCILCVFLLPLSVLAATTLNTTAITAAPGLSVTYEKTGTAGGFSAAVSGNTDIILTASGGSFGISWAGNGNAYLQNGNSDTRILSFTVSYGSNVSAFKIDGTTVEDGREYSVELASTASITASLDSTKGKIATVTLKNVKLQSKDGITVTFAPSENGSYTVDGTKITANTSLLYTGDITGLAVTPSSGYKFAFWADSNGNALSLEEDTILKPETNVTVSAVFAPADAAIYKVGTNYFCYWADAISAAVSGNATVILVESGTLPNSTTQNKVDGTYVVNNGTTAAPKLEYKIPLGVNFVIPYSSTDIGDFDGKPDAKGASADGASVSTRSAFRTLTVSNGATINCAGAINVNAQQFATSNNNPGCVMGQYGHIKLDGDNAKLNVSGSLYCYGYITGSGSVDVTGKIYELMQVMDWRGGNAASSALGKSVFPFSQYYVQNVEADLIVNSGASSYVCAAIEAGLLVKRVYQIAPEYIGSNGFFRLGSGAKIKREYDTANDSMNYTMTGGATTMSSMELSLGGYDMDTAEFIFAINSSMNLTVASDASIVLTEEYKLLPNVDIVVNGTMTVSGDLYIYDYADWMSGGFANKSGDNDLHLVPIGYIATTGKASTRTALAEQSASLTINGTLTVTGGMYTTNGNASTDKVIKGTGTIDFQPTRTTATTIMEAENKYNGSSWEVETKTISVTTALANLAGVGNMQSFTAGTYYGQSDNYWYQHIIKTNIADVITVTSGNGTNGTTLSPMDGREVENIVGLVADGGTLTFTLNGDYVVSVGEEELTPEAGTYTIGEITADTTITLTHRAVHLDAINASADAEIILMLYFTDPCGLLDDTAEVTVTMTTAKTTTTNDVTTTEDVTESTSYTLSDLKVGDRYLVSQPVASGEMTSPVTVTFTDAQGNIIPIYDYVSGTCGTSVSRTVRDYAQRVLAVSEKENQIAIIKALVTYGGYSQLYFGTNTSDPAYSILDEIPTVSDVAISNEDYSINRSGDSIGITQTTQQAYLNSAIYLRVYFEGDTTGLNFTLTSPKGGSTVTTSVTPVQDGSRYYVDIENIPAAYLDNTYTITVTGNGGTYTVNTSVFAYLKDLLDNSKDEKQINAAKAMYLYGTAASEFFDR